jgi:hypothetical protein
MKCCCSTFALRVIRNKLPFNGSGGLITTPESRFAHTAESASAASPFADLSLDCSGKSQSINFHAAFAMLPRRESGLGDHSASHPYSRYVFPRNMATLAFPNKSQPPRSAAATGSSGAWQITLAIREVFALYRDRTMTELHELFSGQHDNGQQAPEEETCVAPHDNDRSFAKKPSRLIVGAFGASREVAEKLTTK